MSSSEYSDASFLCDRLRSESSDPRPRVDELIKILRSFLTTPISVDFLSSTKIGIRVNQIRKQFPESKELSNLSKELINRWKLIVQQTNRNNEIPPPPPMTRSQSLTKANETIKEKIVTENPATKKISKISTTGNSKVAAQTTKIEKKPVANTTMNSKPPAVNNLKPPSIVGHKRSSPDSLVEISLSKKIAPVSEFVEETEEIIGSSENFESKNSIQNDSMPLYNPYSHLFEQEIRDFDSNDSGNFNENSGERKNSTAGPVRLCSLTQICVEFIQFHLNQFSHFEQLPSKLIPQLFSKATPAQLKLIELNNPHLKSDTDFLWRELAMKKFPEFHGEKTKNFISWRFIFEELEKEKQKKINALGEKLKAKQIAAASAKEANSTKQIDPKLAVKTLANRAGTGISIPKLMKPIVPNANRLSNIRAQSQKASKSLWNAKSF